MRSLQILPPDPIREACDTTVNPGRLKVVAHLPHCCRGASSDVNLTGTNKVQRSLPCERSTRIAYSRLVPDDRRVVTWSTAVSVRFTVTPRTRRLGTSSMPGSGGGSTPFRRAENMTITRRGLNDKVTGQRSMQECAIRAGVYLLWRPMSIDCRSRFPL